MIVDIIADTERGAYEYHVRSHLDVMFEDKTLIVPLHSTKRMQFFDLRIEHIDGTGLELTGIDAESGEHRRITIRY